MEFFLATFPQQALAAVLLVWEYLVCGEWIFFAREDGYREGGTSYSATVSERPPSLLAR